MIEVRVEPALGGRIASLRDAAGRERLWSRPDPARAAAVPGVPFVDVGGIEECFPDLNEPDHGDVWCRPWQEVVGAHVVEAEGARLERRIETDDRGFTARYGLDAEPGFRFIWAFHALLRPDEGLTLAPEGAGRVLSWPDGLLAPGQVSSWPAVGDEPRFDRAPADDGTAVFALLPGVERAEVRSETGRLRVALVVDEPQPVGLGVWRNLGGWPASGPYRSWGIEPMIGWHPRRDRAGAGAGVVRSGRLGWSLRVDIDDGAE